MDAKVFLTVYIMLLLTRIYFFGFKQYFQEVPNFHSFSNVLFHWKAFQALSIVKIICTELFKVPIDLKFP